MRRRTKIVATLGPATDSPEVMLALLEAGLDVVRLNFSHGDAKDHAARVKLVRECAREAGVDVAVLGDLQGPKIRIDRFRDGSIELTDGAPFVLDAALGVNDGDENAVGITYKALPQDVAAGDTLLLDDGHIMLKVEAVEGTKIVCAVERGGKLSANKGINRMGGGLSAGALTDKDRDDIKMAAGLDVDYLAVSFPRNSGDIQEARRLLRAADGHAHLVAKIERAEAITNIAGIIQVSDVIMVARGDLGVELGDAELPGLQKYIINETRERNRVVITATQMMESMIDKSIPTRAEVLDVANAVIDGTDAVMLSAETAVGRYPVQAVEAMARVCKGAERQRVTQISTHRVDASFHRIDEAIAMAAMYTANHLNIKAIIALTESGSTTLWMSRIRSGKPVFALTRHDSTRRRVKMYRGVYPVPFDVSGQQPAETAGRVIEALKERGVVTPGDWILFTRGDETGVTGGTNTMQVLAV